MNVKIEGLDELERLLTRAPKNTENALTKELNLIGEDLKGKSQEIAPYKEGGLRKSAYVKSKKLEVEVGYSQEYATAQHEHVEYHHTDGQAKFLETPFKENIKAYTNAIAKVIEGAVK